MDSATAQARRLAATGWLLLVTLLTPVGALRAQNVPETIGRIEGADVAVKGQVSLVEENGRTHTVLASGSEITVRSGAAHIALTEGGEIGICGPAQVSLLKSKGTITLALNSGSLHARLESAVPLTIYTALILATPLGVGSGPRELIVGIERSGAICVVAMRGAVRLEQQLTSLALVVPERGEVALPEGQLESLQNVSGVCRCDIPLAKAEPAPAKTQPVNVSIAASKPPPKKEEAKKEEPPLPASEQPTWKVLMPPLTFEAARPTAPLEPSPETILLVREARVQPVALFTGRVEARVQPAKTAEEKKEKTSLGAKIKNFFRQLFGRKA